MRKKPYTQIGIKRVSCSRCGQPAHAQWNICADGGGYRAICKPCDLELNALVLAWVRDPQAKQKLSKYEGAA